MHKITWCNDKPAFCFMSSALCYIKFTYYYAYWHLKTPMAVHTFRFVAICNRAPTNKRLKLKFFIFFLFKWKQILWPVTTCMDNSCSPDCRLWCLWRHLFVLSFFPTRCLGWDLGLNLVSYWGFSFLLLWPSVRTSIRDGSNEGSLDMCLQRNVKNFHQMIPITIVWYWALM